MVVVVVVVVVSVILLGRWLLAARESYHVTRDCLHFFVYISIIFHFPLFYAGCRVMNFCQPPVIDGRFDVKAGIARHVREGLCGGVVQGVVGSYAGIAGWNTHCHTP